MPLIVPIFPRPACKGKDDFYNPSSDLADVAGGINLLRGRRKGNNPLFEIIKGFAVAAEGLIIANCDDIGTLILSLTPRFSAVNI
jgi:hypothetical protein